MPPVRARLRKTEGWICLKRHKTFQSPSTTDVFLASGGIWAAGCSHMPQSSLARSERKLYLNCGGKGDSTRSWMDNRPHGAKSTTHTLSHTGSIQSAFSTHPPSIMIQTPQHSDCNSVFLSYLHFAQNVSLHYDRLLSPCPAMGGAKFIFTSERMSGLNLTNSETGISARETLQWH